LPPRFPARLILPFCQTGSSFFACPASGQVSWDPPVGSFVYVANLGSDIGSFLYNRLPPSEEGEWWELTDESRGLAYYYQTKTGETVWERPPGFVIPLGILQVRFLVFLSFQLLYLFFLE